MRNAGIGQEPPLATASVSGSTKENNLHPKRKIWLNLLFLATNRNPGSLAFARDYARS